jgi:catechol 2,3-dioxygenase-like lactoylglutathione lyase family enzyme
MQNINDKKEDESTMIKRRDYQLPPKEGFILTHFLTVSDVKRSAEFYFRILGGNVVREGEPTIIQIANSWLILNVGGGPTDDKPTVTLRTPQNASEASNFMNVRVADIQSCYEEWQKRGAEFLTEPKDHRFEIRCYMHDPDGYIIEVGQSKNG